jgi:hypothetical protein
VIDVAVVSREQSLISSYDLETLAPDPTCAVWSTVARIAPNFAHALAVEVPFVWYVRCVLLSSVWC